MNDFTKDELEIIHDGLCYAAGASVETGGMMKHILYPVAKKIQCMIDNYCEHDYRSMGNHPWLHCIKCRDNFDFTETKI